jgi:elongation factor Ts
MTATLELIKKLRAETRAGIQGCRKALEHTDLDYEKALAYLREQEIAPVGRDNRPSADGVLEVYAHGNGRIGVMVEINTETDFVGRSAIFKSFAHEIALQIAAATPAYISEAEIPAEVILAESEQKAATVRAEGKAETIIPRIVAGYLEKFKDEQVLLRQAYIRDDKITVAQFLSQTSASVGEKIVIRRFVRWELDGDLAVD